MALLPWLFSRLRSSTLAASVVHRLNVSAATVRTNGSSTAPSLMLPHRSYTLSVAPTLRLAQAAALLHGRVSASGRLCFRGAAAWRGPLLTEHERIASNVAKRTGFLRMAPHCGTATANAYFTFCVATRRPYIAVDRHNMCVFVDLQPVLGVAATSVDSREAAQAANSRAAADEAEVVQRRAAGSTHVEAAITIVRMFLASQPRPRPFVVNTVGLQKQLASVSSGSMEGSDAQRPADPDISDKFTLYPSHRGGADVLATALYTHLSSVLKLSSTAEVGARRDAVRVARAERWARLTTRRLTRLVADERAVRSLRVKAGALDGFATALATARAGAVPVLAPPGCVLA